jgi:L-aminopeptidase/D-esterase-like protein
MVGLGRTGSSMTNGSGDYAIAFSTANRINADQTASATYLYSATTRCHRSSKP